MKKRQASSSIKVRDEKVSSSSSSSNSSISGNSVVNDLSVIEQAPKLSASLADFPSLGATAGLPVTCTKFTTLANSWTGKQTFKNMENVRVTTTTTFSSSTSGQSDWLNRIPDWNYVGGALNQVQQNVVDAFKQGGTIDNADKVDGYHASQLGRLAEACTWTGAQTFNGGISTTNVNASGNVTVSSKTANTVAIINGSKQIDSSAITTTELGYLDNARSNIQSQLDEKLSGANPTLKGTITTEKTANRAVIINGSKQLDTSSVTSTELEYVSGVTSAIQTQLNAKMAARPNAIEMSGASTNGGFIDFHYNNSTADYTSRIIEDSSGQLSISKCVLANGSTATTQDSTDNSNKIATTKFVKNVLGEKAPIANPTFTGSIGTQITESHAVITDASKKLAASTTTSTELGYVHGVTSAIQTQLNAKAPTAFPTFTGNITTPITGSSAVVTNSSKQLAASTTTSTELGYVHGVTSAIQTQLNDKAPIASPAFTGNPTAPTQASTDNSTRLATTAFVQGRINNHTHAVYTTREIIAGCERAIFYGTGTVSYGYRARYNISEGNIRITCKNDWTSYKYIEIMLCNAGGYQYSTTGLINVNWLETTLNNEVTCNIHNKSAIEHRLLLPTAYNSVGLATVQSIKNSSAIATVTIHTFPAVDESSITVREDGLLSSSISSGTDMTLKASTDQGAYYWQGSVESTVNQGTALFADDYLTFVKVSDLDIVYIAGYN